MARLGIFAKKIGMTQIFENGLAVPVSVLDTTGCEITQVKTKDNDGYNALQIGIGDRKPQNLRRSMSGHLKKAGVKPKALVREIRLDATDDMAAFKPGQTLKPTMLQKGDRVDVTGLTRGKGFTGVMKRLGYAGKDATHGTSKYFRHGGSSGTNTFPGKVLKNKGMPGQCGNSYRTTQNIEVVDVRADDNLILLKGSVPGPTTGLLVIRSSIKHKVPEARAWV